VLRQHDRLRASAGSLAGRFLQQVELPLEWGRIEFGRSDHQRQLRRLQTLQGRSLGIKRWIGAEIGFLWLSGGRSRQMVDSRNKGSTGETDPATLQAHIEISTTIVDAWRAAEMKTFLACYDGVLARLLTAAGMKEAARERVELALQMADETEMHFYDAELLRIRAHTFDEPDDNTWSSRHRATQTQSALFEHAPPQMISSYGEPARRRWRAALASA
jgi:hypothetical protein